MKGSFVNAKVIIKSIEDNDQQYSARVEDYDSVGNVISIDETSFQENKNFVLKNGMKVKTTIFADSGIWNYKGTLRKNNNLKIDIALYGGVRKNDRVARRYTINYKAKVISIFKYKDKNYYESDNIVKIINISRSGVLISAEDSLCDIGDLIMLEYNVQKKKTVIKCQVLRKKLTQDPKIVEYACEFTELMG